MTRKLILVPDKCLFKSWIENNFNLSILDDIEKTMGPIIISKYLLDDMINNEVNKDVIAEFFIRNSWLINLSKYYDTYLKIILHISKKYNISKDAIEKDMISNFKHFMRKYKSFNPGLAQDDIGLLLISQYIKQYTKYAPIIISDDSDLLIQGHLLSSFYGVPNTILSIYELLQYTNKKDILDDYVKYREIPKLNFTNFLQKNNKENILNELKILTNKNLLSFHPYLPDNENFLKSTRL